MGVKQKVTATQRCKICNKPDYCFRLQFDDGLIHYCARTAEKSVFSGGNVYVWKYSKDTTIGRYNCYQEKEEMEKQREEFIRNRKTSTYNSAGNNNKMPYKNTEIPHTSVSVTGDSLIEGEEAVTDDLDRLDAVYRRFLSLLCLEEDDYMHLRNDWNKPTTGDLISKVLSFYPIKTLPPNDYVRNLPNYSRKLKSLTRNQICKILVKEFGELNGIPGFYKDRNGWNYAGKEGILFPIYQKGKLIRLRIRDSFPNISGTFEGKEGIFTHKYSPKGEHEWYFTGKNDGDEKQLVFSADTKKIQLKPDGCPKGKASGKYKNFASVWEKRVFWNGETKIINGYGSGCRSGSHISLYCKPGDDFSVVYVTEGEKKAMIANLLLGVPVISLPGTGTFAKLFEKDGAGESMIDYLKRKGMKMVVIAYDADKNTNINVLKQEQAAIKRFMEESICIAIGEWNANFGKGLDDILVQGVRPSIYLCQ